MTTTPSTAFSATYGYGTAGRFASANVTSGSLPNGDVKARNVTYQYNASDPEQLDALKVGTATWASYTYDLAGNQLSRDYPSGQHPSNEHWDYAYDGKNQLRRVTKKINNVVQGIEEYWYDQANTRRLVVRKNASSTKTGATWFVEDTEAEYDAVGATTRAYGHVSLGTPVVRTERVGDAPASVEYQFHGVANNTIAAVAQATGTVNATFNYAPFGEVVEAGGTTAGLTSHRRRMNDKFVDDISGLTYYGYRYYDKHSMTWTQGDPLYRFAPDTAWDAPRRSNLYTMSLNNPVRYLDPDGRYPDAISIPVGAVEAALKYVEQIEFKINIEKTDRGGRSTGIPGAHWLSDFIFDNSGWEGQPPPRYSNPLEDPSVDALSIGLKGVGPGSVPGAPGKGPNPYGKKGGPAHQAKVEDVKKDVESRGLKASTEHQVKTPGGEKGSRFVDVVGKDEHGNVVEMHQVGKQNKNGSKVAREQRAIDDIEDATDHKIEVEFHPYNTPQ